MQRGEPCLLSTFIHRTNFNFVKDLAKVSPWHPKAPCRQGMTRLHPHSLGDFLLVFCLRAMAWMMRIDARNLASGKIITSCVVVFFLAREHTVQSARFFQAPVWQPCTTQDISFGSLLDPRARPWGISFGIWWNNLGWSELQKMVALEMGPWKNERSGQGHLLEWKSMIFRCHVKPFGGTKALPVSGSCSSLKLSVDIPNFLAAVCWWKISHIWMELNPFIRSSSMIFHDCQWLSSC